jgi:AraC-like DNA-binding protein
LSVARDLILYTNLPIQEVASQVGLVDASHLTRLFHEHYDCTPGSLRQEPRDTYVIVEK